MTDTGKTYRQLIGSFSVLVQSFLMLDSGLMFHAILTYAQPLRTQLKTEKRTRVQKTVPIACLFVYSQPKMFT